MVEQFDARWNLTSFHTFLILLFGSRFKSSLPRTLHDEFIVLSVVIATKANRSGGGFWLGWLFPLEY